MGSMTSWMDRRLYGRYPDNWDNWLFRERIDRHLTPDAVVLDLGAGAGIVEATNLRGKAARVCGIDLDPRVRDNPFLDEAKITDAGTIPYDDNTFDLVICNNVVEHLEEPVAVFVQVARVLKPGGRFLFKTPNRTHYMPLIARFTPYAFHEAFNKMRGRERDDTFPTFYRANSKNDAEVAARAAGLVPERIERLEGRPEYLRMTVPTYLAGFLYERTVNATEKLAALRVVLIAELRRASDA